MFWVAYFKRSLFSKIWIAVGIASAVLAIIRNVAQGGETFADKLLGILGGIIGGIAFTLFIDVVFSLLFATIYAGLEKKHKTQ